MKETTLKTRDDATVYTVAQLRRAFIPDNFDTLVAYYHGGELNAFLQSKGLRTLEPNQVDSQEIIRNLASVIECELGEVSVLPGGVINSACSLLHVNSFASAQEVCIPSGAWELPTEWNFDVSKTLVGRGRHRTKLLIAPREALAPGASIVDLAVVINISGQKVSFRKLAFERPAGVRATLTVNGGGILEFEDVRLDFDRCLVTGVELKISSCSMVWGPNLVHDKPAYIDGDRFTPGRDEATPSEPSVPTSASPTSLSSILGEMLRDWVEADKPLQINVHAFCGYEKCEDLAASLREGKKSRGYVLKYLCDACIVDNLASTTLPERLRSANHEARALRTRLMRIALGENPVRLKEGAREIMVTLFERPFISDYWGT